MNTARTVRERFTGAWKLISCEAGSQDGRIDYPYGNSPVGRLTYDAAGRMSAQLMQPDGDAHVAYFGTFHIEEPVSTAVHHVPACLVRNWVGTDLKRSCRFEANRLILTAVTDSVRTLTWEREPD